MREREDVIKDIGNILIRRRRKGVVRIQRKGERWVVETRNPKIKKIMERQLEKRYRNYQLDKPLEIEVREVGRGEEMLRIWRVTSGEMVFSVEEYYGDAIGFGARSVEWLKILRLRWVKLYGFR